MFKGLRTIIYPVKDVTAAKAWYTEILGTQPYFDQPFYVGFNVGGYELGLSPSENDEQPVTYWGVDDIQAAYDQLIAAGAKERQKIEDVGGDIKVASVTDKDGNVVGIIQNPHFKTDEAR